MLPSAPVYQGYVLSQSAVPVSAPADTSENILATITVQANVLGLNSFLRIRTAWTLTNNANAKTLRVRFSGIGGTILFASSLINAAGGTYDGWIANRNAANSQFSAFVGFFASAVLTPPSVTAAVDTTVSTSVVITMQKATAGDTVTLESYFAEVLYKP